MKFTAWRILAKIKLLLLILVCLIPLYDNSQVNRRKIWKDKWNSWYVNRRMLYLMRTIHRDCLARHKLLNHLRFMYEESPFYEMGYIMGEIIERYRKMITHVRRRWEWKNIFIHELIRRVQIVQHLYLEIYNLQRMMHEVDIKYRNTLEFQNIHQEVDMSEVIKQELALEAEIVAVEKKKQRDLKRLKKLRKKFASANKHGQMFQTKAHQTGMWPIEYGWDIGTDWLY